MSLWRLLEEGEEIHREDEVYNPNSFKWERVSIDMIGETFHMRTHPAAGYYPIRRGMYSKAGK